MPREAAMVRRRRPLLAVALLLAAMCALRPSLGGVGFIGGAAPRPIACRTAARATPEEVQPLGDCLLVRPRDAARATAAGLLLSKAVAGPPSEGQVLAVGPGRFDEETGRRTPMSAEVGQHVVYDRHGAQRVKLQGDEHLLVHDSALLLSFDGPEATLESVRMPAGKLLVRLRGKIGESEGGILLAQGAQKVEAFIGEVVAVSEGVRSKDGTLVAMDVAVGDIVQFRFGEGVMLGGSPDEFRVVEYHDCIARWSE